MRTPSAAGWARVLGPTLFGKCRADKASARPTRGPRATVAMRKLLSLSLAAVAATFFSWPTVVAAAPPSQGTPVAVISTLHQFHEKVPGYGFDTLREILEKLHPDVLAVELTAKDLDNRLSKSIKREYQRSVFPFLQEYQDRKSVA